MAIVISLGEDVLDALRRSRLRLRSVGLFDYPYPLGLRIGRIAGCAPDGVVEIDLDMPRESVAAGQLSDVITARLIHTLNAVGPHLHRYGGASYRAVLDLSDHGSEHGVSMDRPVGSARPMMPDLYALEAAQSPLVDSTFEAFSRDYRARRRGLFWRGSTTGRVMTAAEDVRVNARVRFCLHAATLGNEADCRLSAITQVFPHERDVIEARLRELGIFGDRVSEDAFLAWTIYPDLDGNTSSWGSIHKFVGGMTVLKVQGDRETDFSSQLQNWRTMVRVREDLADLDAKCGILLAEPELAEQIAWNGRQAAAAYLRGAGDRLHAALTSPAAQALAASFEA